MNAADLALFDLDKLIKLLAHDRCRVFGKDWTWDLGLGLGYPDDEPRTAGWVSRFFGVN